ncbi:polysaccharide biosynthesis tyrosine autokinase [Nocardia blacklockiae]|uniref:polysaccharide biosynthesis tyrosine autokinase n=1 Tax=Nocardia blacklockiae TaxID=480036 RepID=UPI0018942D5C|nr:polysaccharide biosynthesis tyrosine autokinase [Nocardia blacklockiae]MBF6176276.1 protein tyrosine kinase [Nocardia blacklockiae]
MGLIDIWRIARRRWPIVLTALLLCTAAAYGYSKSQPVTYTASSSCYVSMATGTSVNDSYQGGLAAQQRVRSYLELAGSETVAQRVKDQLGLKESTASLRGRITAASPPATTVIVVSARDSTADGARVLADEVVSQFRYMIAQLETIQVDAAPAARVAVVDKAQLPTAPSSPQSSRTLLLGVFAGLVVGFAAAFARDRLDRRLRGSADLEAILPVPILGIIDDGRPGAPGELRRLRTRLGPDTAGVLLTSLSQRSQPAVAADLARTLADCGDRVVLVDADTTGQGSSGRIPVQATAGLAELLRHSTPLDDAITPWAEAGVSVLPIGVIDSRTPDLLASERFAEIMSKLHSEFDRIVVEGAPISAAADAIVLARHCDAVLGVVELGTATVPQVRGALATLGTEAKLTGAVAFTPAGGTMRDVLARLGRRG